MGVRTRLVRVALDHRDHALAALAAAPEPEGAAILQVWLDWWPASRARIQSESRRSSAHGSVEPRHQPPVRGQHLVEQLPWRAVAVAERGVAGDRLDRRPAAVLERGPHAELMDRQLLAHP